MSTWIHTQKTAFQLEFSLETQVADEALQYNHITERKLKIGSTVSKWRPQTQFSCRDKKIPAKNWKTIFPREFCNKIWLIIVKHKYIHIAEIKFEKSYSSTILEAKQICNSALIMVIYAN